MYLARRRHIAADETHTNPIAATFMDGQTTTQERPENEQGTMIKPSKQGFSALSDAKRQWPGMPPLRPDSRPRLLGLERLRARQEAQKPRITYASLWMLEAPWAPRQPRI